MTSTTMNAQIVRIFWEEGDEGLYYATSPELEGLFVPLKSLDEMDSVVPEAIRDLYAACGVSVIVTPVDQKEDHREWVAVPTEVAQAELDKQAVA